MTNSKDKGKRGEREAAKALEHVFGCDAARGVQYQGGPGSPDVVHDIYGIHFEVKRNEALRLYDAVEQATKDAGESVPVVLHRKNGKPWLLIVPLLRVPDFVTKMYLHWASK